MDSGCPLLDKRQSMWERHDWSAKQTLSHYSSFPMRSSVSAHEILSDSLPNRRHGLRTSGAGVWINPFSQNQTPTPSIQPVRIDIPVTRAVKTQLKPPLTTFQSSSFLEGKVGPTPTVNGHNKSLQNQNNYGCANSAVKQVAQPLFLSQQQRTSRSQASLSPVKHVSFHEPTPTQQKGISPMKQNKTQELSDPWRREAQEKLEKQQGLHVVELLQQEVKKLQAKAKRSAEENDRVRKLNLEWQFQKRLQEIQQKGEDEEEDEDEDLDMMVMIQQLETRAQVKHMSWFMPRRNT